MKNKKAKVQPVSRPKAAGISGPGKKVIFAGIMALVAGYFILTKTDPMGQNWASKLSPFIILAGYALIGIGIVVPDKQKEEPVAKN